MLKCTGRMPPDARTPLLQMRLRFVFGMGQTPSPAYVATRICPQRCPFVTSSFRPFHVFVARRRSTPRLSFSEDARSCRPLTRRNGAAAAGAAGAPLRTESSIVPGGRPAHAGGSGPDVSCRQHSSRATAAGAGTPERHARPAVRCAHSDPPAAAHSSAWRSACNAGCFRRQRRVVPVSAAVSFSRSCGLWRALPFPAGKAAQRHVFSNAEDGPPAGCSQAARSTRDGQHKRADQGRCSCLPASSCIRQWHSCSSPGSRCRRNSSSRICRFPAPALHSSATGGSPAAEAEPVDRCPRATAGATAAITAADASTAEAHAALPITGGPNGTGRRCVLLSSFNLAASRCISDGLISLSGTVVVLRTC